MAPSKEQSIFIFMTPFDSSHRSFYRVGYEALRLNDLPNNNFYVTKQGLKLRHLDPT